MDLISRQSLVLTSARYVVLDEADEMLDLGFIEDVEKILRMTPSGRQTLLFSATMPAPVAKLAETYMYDPVTIRVTPKKLTVDSVEQAYVRVEPRDKLKRVVEVLKAEEPEQAIIFCRTKRGVDKIQHHLMNAVVIDRHRRQIVREVELDVVIVAVRVPGALRALLFVLELRERDLLDVPAKELHVRQP